jgi:hypothetical protein
MNNKLKITLNILIFALIAGFGYYIVHSTISEEKTKQSGIGNQENAFVSPYKKTNSFDAASDIICFYIFKNSIYAASVDNVSIYDLSGKRQFNFKIEKDIRDILVEEETIYLLYPTRIALYSPDGQKKSEWDACSPNSIYCSFTTTGDYVFVTDAENKHIWQLDKEGMLVRAVKSPEGFIIPSYAFDIININDTIYCSNSGRHKIESYTLDGEFIASFGTPGAQAGAFIGCCNPAYLEKSSNGHILTSEKGSPRISCYGKDGKFRTVLFDSNALGGGTTAYEIGVSGEDIYIANKRTITVYSFDATLSEKSCAGCEENCPLRKELVLNLLQAVLHRFSKISGVFPALSYFSRVYS